VAKIIHIPTSLLNRDFTFTSEVERFSQEGGWHFVRVPPKYTELTRDFSDRGLVAITATVGKSTWKTSLLPYGDGTHFLALSSTIRKKEKISHGDEVSVVFRLRER
jgi:hypothetical protein